MDEFRVRRFLASEDPEGMRRCQRLRYEVYFEELGLSPPAMNHERRLDIEPNDRHCLFITIEERDSGELIGCIRLQPPGVAEFYSGEEFLLTDDWWHQTRLAEGARFAVREAYRNSVVPLMLFDEFRDYCRQNDIGSLISTVVVPDAHERLDVARGALGFFRGRVAFDFDRAEPRPGYKRPEIEGLDVEDLVDFEATDADQMPAMVRMLANPRTTVCSRPAYCDGFESWVFLLVTELSRSRG